MADDDAAKKKEKPMTFAKLNTLAIQLDSKQARTSFGKLPLSDEFTQPIFSVGRATRPEQAKVFLGELTV
jgi:hypothetical protein